MRLIMHKRFGHFLYTRLCAIREKEPDALTSSSAIELMGVLKLEKPISEEEIKEFKALLINHYLGDKE